MSKVDKRNQVFLIVLGVLIGLFILIDQGNAQDQEFIYGKVTTIDNDVYTGQIRWGKEETFWSDQFDAQKVSDNRKWRRKIEESIRKERRNEDSWQDLDWKIFSIWENNYRSSSHQFDIRFGDLKSIEYLGRNRVIMSLKDGLEIPLDGEGYNDVGARIQIFDFELGEIVIKGDRVDRVDFMPTPKNLKSKFGDPLYGMVHTYQRSSFTGLVTWDHDENLDFEKLDGDSRDGDVSIPFGNIKMIQSEGRGSLVTFSSRRELYLRGSNDVDGSNNGIWINVEGLGQVDITWRDFDWVEFDHSNHNSGLDYNSYDLPKKLSGKVVTVGGKEYEGEMIFDLNEEYDFELLDGTDDDIKFEVPFRNIRRIQPKNYNYSTVELKSGEKLLLGDDRDVSDKNDGIIVLISNDDPIHIRWEEIDEIIFK